MNKANLILLGQYIYAHVTDAQFDMAHFRQDHQGILVNFREASDCGTVGCALGHAPLVPGLEPIRKDFDGRGYLDFDGYSERVFGLDHSQPDWDWLFSDLWAREGNSRHDFLGRLLRLLRGGPELVGDIDPTEIMDL